MNREIAMKWADDLEANAHLQGQGRLITKDGRYCCLGRLYLALGESLEYTEGAQQYVLSEKVKCLAELDTIVGNWDDEKVHVADAMCLSELNDEAEWTFPQIAEFIRENWEHL